MNEIDHKTCHTSVLPRETLDFLSPQPGATVVDGTLGGGGHTRLLAEAVGPQGLVIAIDRDGAISLSFNSEGMYRAWVAADGVLRVAIYGDG